MRKAVLKTIVEALLTLSDPMRHCYMSLYGSCSKTQKHQVPKVVHCFARDDYLTIGRRRFDQVYDVRHYDGKLLIKWSSVTQSGLSSVY